MNPSGSLIRGDGCCREGAAHGRLPRRILLLTVFIGSLALVSAYGETPGWWTTRGVLNTNWPANDYAPVLAGQLKWMATNAAAELETLPGGAGTGVHALVSGFTLSNNYVPINLGQLKNTAAPFYQRLMAVGYATNYPWTETTADDADFAPAVLGQLKYAFDFDVSTDSDGDDLPDWWEIYWFGSVASWTGLGDPDGDGLDNAAEYAAGSNPNAEDTDSDGLDDHDEVVVYGTNPGLPDTDGDGHDDGAEVAARTDPLNADTTSPVVVIEQPSEGMIISWIP